MQNCSTITRGLHLMTLVMQEIEAGSGRWAQCGGQSRGWRIMNDLAKKFQIDHQTMIDVVNGFIRVPPEPPRQSGDYVLVTIRLRATQPDCQGNLALLLEDYLANGILASDLFEYQDGWATSMSGGNEGELENLDFEIEVVDHDVQVHKGNPADVQGRRFWKTIFRVVVLSEEPYEPDNLGDIHYDITQGHCSGAWEKEAVIVLDGPSAAAALLAQGTSPEFFLLSEDGETLEE